MQVRVLEYDPAHEQLVVRASWVHSEEVWDIACSPADADQFVTVHSKGKATATHHRRHAHHSTVLVRFLREALSGCQRSGAQSHTACIVGA